MCGHDFRSPAATAGTFNAGVVEQAPARPIPPPVSHVPLLRASDFLPNSRLAGIGLHVWDPIGGQRCLNPAYAQLHRPQHIDRPGVVAPAMPKVASAPAPTPGPGGPPPYTGPSDGSAGSGGTQPLGSPHGATAPGSSPDRVTPPPL